MTIKWCIHVYQISHHSRGQSVRHWQPSPLKNTVNTQSPPPSSCPCIGAFTTYRQYYVVCIFPCYCSCSFFYSPPAQYFILLVTFFRFALSALSCFSHSWTENSYVFFFYYFYFPLLFCYIDICSDAVAIVATYGNNGMQLVKCYYVSLPIIYCCSVIKIFSEVCK